MRGVRDKRHRVRVGASIYGGWSERVLVVEQLKLERQFEASVESAHVQGAVRLFELEQHEPFQRTGENRIVGN